MVLGKQLCLGSGPTGFKEQHFIWGGGAFCIIFRSLFSVPFELPLIEHYTGDISDTISCITLPDHKQLGKKTLKEFHLSSWWFICIFGSFYKIGCFFYPILIICGFSGNFSFFLKFLAMGRGFIILGNEVSPQGVSSIGRFMFANSVVL